MDGGLMEVLNDVIREALFEVIEDLLKTENFKVNIEPGSKKGDNFLGIVYRIIFSTADGKKSSKLFLKIAPESEEHREKMFAHQAFAREIYVYNEVLPNFREFQQSRDIVVSKDGFHEYTQCYKCLDAEPFECLLLQDVTEKGFEMINKDELTVEHILLVMKALGKFHAVSYAMKDQQPDKFSEMINKLHENILRHGYNQNLIEAYNSASMFIINAITDEKDVHLLEAVLKLYETNQFDILVNCVDSTEAEPYAAIIHGDLWSNNTMFKMNKQNKPRKMCMIDWQICRYASPILDLVYYIFVSTTRQLRGRNYNIYLKTYHESLSNHLTRLGSNVDKLFPYKAMEDQLRKFGKFGLVSASLVLPILYHEKNMPGSKADDENSGKVTELSDGLSSRLRDIVADMYRLGYI